MKRINGFSIDPVVFLERNCIDAFSIDYENSVVLLPEVEFKRVSWLVGKNIASTATAFNAFGWKWQQIKK